MVKSGGVSCEVIQHSISPQGKEILTVSVKYGLIIHSEFLRHRQLSRGVKSNRAIPAKVIRREVLEDPYTPQWFGKNKSGMVSEEQVRFPWIAKKLWRTARYPACGFHWLGEKLGVHKEILNRLLNPWQWVRETITATEWDNLYNLRRHKDAQRDIKEVVDAIYECHTKSNPNALSEGEWHVPYVKREWDNQGVLHYWDNDGMELSQEQAIKCSAARCARSSYDNHDNTSASYKVDCGLYDMLVTSKPAHASPVEHQATPMKVDAAAFSITNSWTEGLTHVDKSCRLWSGNFEGWTQHRQTLNNHVCEKYVPH